MKKILRNKFVSRWLRPASVAFSLSLIFATAAFAQATGASPWENAVNVLMQAFTTTIARGLSLVSIVVAGLTFAFGEGGSKRVLAGVLFGVGIGHRRSQVRGLPRPGAASVLMTAPFHRENVRRLSAPQKSGFRRRR